VQNGIVLMQASLRLTSVVSPADASGQPLMTPSVGTRFIVLPAPDYQSGRSARPMSITGPSNGPGKLKRPRSQPFCRRRRQAAAQWQGTTQPCLFGRRSRST
jgi:hypothetical protein